MNILFEAMAEKHCSDVMGIFNYYVENSFAACPECCLPEQAYAKFLELTSGYPAFVMRDADTSDVVGFCFLRAYNPFSSFKKAAEITYFIKPDYTGKGLGTAALKKIEDEAKNKGIRYILASITSRNEQSLAFHRKNGFAECGNFKKIGEKNGISFDLIWMQKKLK